MDFRRRWLVVATLGTLALILAVVFYLPEASRRRDKDATAKAFRAISAAVSIPEGFWTGDVAGLHERSKLPRDIAEADIRPIKPLVDRPRPYHGYLFVAMESGPSLKGNGEEPPVPLKGKQVSAETFAICAFPAEKGTGWVYLISAGGRYAKIMEGGVPVLELPKELRTKAGWSILD